MADDAGHLLRDEFELPIVEELRPQQLSERIDIASHGPGARNVAVLVTTKTPDTTKKLLKDLAEISKKHDRIAGTALAALLPSDGSGANVDCPPLVTPLRANPAQRAVLRSAMTQRLTVATGPPGTGKTQVIVNAVATAISAEQTVLVASTNNEAVNEVWRRCEKLVPGSLIRTGAKKYLAEEATGLKTLLTAGPPDVETSPADHRIALRRLEKDERELGRTGALEADLHRAGRDRIAAQERVGHSADEFSELLGRRWGRRPEGWRAHGCWVSGGGAAS